LSHFGFVDFNAESRAVARADEPACFLDGIAFADDVAAPWDVGVDGFADDVARRREAEFQGRGGADRALRIVRGDGNAMRFGDGSNSPRFAQAATMGDVGLNDADGPVLQEI